MKTYNNRPGKKIKSDNSKTWELSYKCKRCKTINSIVFSDLKVDKARLDIDDFQVDKRKSSKLFKRFDNYYRDIYEVISVYSNTCTHCGKRKNLFNKSNEPKEFEYSEWDMHERYRCWDYSCCY